MAFSVLLTSWLQDGISSCCLRGWQPATPSNRRLRDDVKQNKTKLSSTLNVWGLNSFLIPLIQKKIFLKWEIQKENIKLFHCTLVLPNFHLISVSQPRDTVRHGRESASLRASLNSDTYWLCDPGQVTRTSGNIPRLQIAGKMPGCFAWGSLLYRETTGPLSNTIPSVSQQTRKDEVSYSHSTEEKTGWEKWSDLPEATQWIRGRN